MQPRAIRFPSDDRPAVIYTDGAFESEHGTWGAVVVVPRLGINAIHGGSVDNLMRHWTSHELQQKICQIELVAVLLVRYCYRKELATCSAMYFVDNEAPRYCLVKGSSPSVSMCNISRMVSHIEAEHPSASRYERVPSASNIADVPSRFKFDECQQITTSNLAGDIVLPHEMILELINLTILSMSKIRG